MKPIPHLIDQGSNHCHFCGISTGMAFKVSCVASSPLRDQREKADATMVRLKEMLADPDIHAAMKRLAAK